jgi:hypothetical protein
MIVSRVKALIPAPVKQRLRWWPQAVRIRAVAAITLASFFLLHRKFGPTIDQRQLWEGRWEWDVAIIPTVDDDPYYRGLDEAMHARLTDMIPAAAALHWARPRICQSGWRAYQGREAIQCRVGQRECGSIAVP